MDEVPVLSLLPSWNCLDGPNGPNGTGLELWYLESAGSCFKCFLSASLRSLLVFSVAVAGKAFSGMGRRWVETD